MIDKIEVTDITIVTGSGDDCVIINTTLPDGCWPFNVPAHVRLEVAKSFGEEYVRKNFPKTRYNIVHSGG